MSPAALARHGLDYESVAARNPRVVYGIVSAFGHAGPEASLPGMDVVAQARSGLMEALGAERDGLPVHSEVQVADYAVVAAAAGRRDHRAVRPRAHRVGARRSRCRCSPARSPCRTTACTTCTASTKAWRDPFLRDDLPRLRVPRARGVGRSRRSVRRPGPTRGSTARRTG